MYYIALLGKSMHSIRILKLALYQRIYEMTSTGLGEIDVSLTERRNAHPA
jgi:hypothetical protein